MGSGWPSLPGVDALYFLGTGGPEQPEDVGDVEAFRWRFATVSAGDGRFDVLAFTSMPELIAFTRSINDARPQTVPTEALRLTSDDIAAGADVWCRVDPEPQGIVQAAASGGLGRRRLPELSEGAKR